MKKKIIAFLSSFAISAIAFGGIIANATSPSYAYNDGTSTTFSVITSGSNIMVRGNGYAGQVKALNSHDYYFHKYVEITAYHYNSDLDDFEEKNCGWNTGNDKTITATTTLTTDTTNTLVIGLIGYSSISQTGWHYAGVANTRSSNSVPYVYEDYYDYLEGYAQ